MADRHLAPDTPELRSRWGYSWRPNASWSELPNWARVCLGIWLVSFLILASGYVPEEYEVYVFLAGLIPAFLAASYMAYLNLTEATRTGNDG